MKTKILAIFLALFAFGGVAMNEDELDVLLNDTIKNLNEVKIEDKKEDKLTKELNKNYANFEKISISNVVKAIKEVNEQDDSYTCGLINGKYICVIKGLDDEKWEKIFPLSVYLPVNIAKMINNMNKSLALTNKNEFKVGPTPVLFADGMNKLLEKQTFKAEAAGFEDVSSEDIIGIVKNNFKYDLPTVIWVAGSGNTIHVMSIFAIDEKNNQVGVIDTYGEGSKRTKIYNLDELIEKMNMKTTKKFLNNLSSIVPDQLLLFARMMGCVLDKSTSDSLNYYNLIKFTDNN